MATRLHKPTQLLLLCALLTLALMVVNLLWGSVKIPLAEAWSILCGRGSDHPTWEYIILESRLPQTLTAWLSGMALAVSGLMLQTVFNNPLASPSILGVNTGASLGVAIVMLLLGGSIGSSVSEFALSGHLAIVTGAFLGASAVLGIIIFFSTLIRSNITLLIIGLMVSYVASSAISLLNFFATAEGVFAYTIWGMGDFSGISLDQIPTFATFILLGIVVSILLIKPMNALLLGERYAENLGVHVRRVRILMLLSTGVLTATVTAFCGPIAFIGMAVPHIARLLLGSSNHNTLLPATLLLGGISTLLCNLLSSIPGSSQVIPLNAITPILGAPVIIYVIINQKRIQYFN